MPENNCSSSSTAVEPEEYFRKNPMRHRVGGAPVAMGGTHVTPLPHETF